MSTRPEQLADIFAGSGESRAIARAVDWSATPLGPVEAWPEGLRTAVRVCMASRTTMAVWAGPQFTLVHNDGYIPILGPKSAWAMGRPAREVWPEVWDVLEPEFEEVRSGAATRHDEARFRIEGAGGPRDAYFTYSLTPLGGDGGRILGILNVLEETTREVERGEFLAFALSTAGLGTWDVDLTDRTARRSREHGRIFGYDPFDPEWSYERFLGHVLPEDREAVDAQVRRASESGEELNFECRIAPRAGGTRWIWCAARVRADARGHRHLAGIVQDVTARKEAEEALRASEERYRTLFESIDEGFCVIEVIFEGEHAVDYRFLQMNPAFVRQTGLENAQGRRVRELVPQHDAHWFETYGRIATTGEPLRFENAADALGRYYDVYAFRVGAPGERRVAVLFNDISNRRKSEEALRATIVELREAQARLEEADRRKNEFLGVLSHELRNPLAPIKNGLYLLEHVDPGGEQARRARGIVGRQVDQLARLVDDLLDVTRISRNKVQLRRERLELNALVRRTLEDYRPTLEAAGLDVTLTESPEPLFVDADPKRMAQVIGNLLHNAAKFTPSRGRVLVSVGSENGRAALSVADTGMGLTPEIASRLFEPFSQADATLDRSKGGLGLGLALVKTLVELHGGEVEGHSEGPGRGSAFTLRLPLDVARAGSEERGAPSKPSVRRRILVIEDNVDSAETLREVLEMDGHEVSVAHDGVDGLARARAVHPDVVLCDIGLPGLDGYAVARALKADASLRDARLVAVTGYALPDDVKRALEAGFERHLAKPLTPARLDEILREATAL